MNVCFIVKVFEIEKENVYIVHCVTDIVEVCKLPDQTTLKLLRKAMAWARFSLTALTGCVLSYWHVWQYAVQSSIAWDTALYPGLESAMAPSSLF